MNIRVDEAKLSADQLAITKFGIGQPVLRREDPVLVQGKGSYTDDVSLPGQVYMAMVRSPWRSSTVPETIQNVCLLVSPSLNSCRPGSRCGR